MKSITVLFSFITFFAFNLQLIAQDINQKNLDSLIQVVGRVISSVDKTSVKAKIIFERLPYGDDLHIIKSDEEKGYSLLLRVNNEYSVQIKEDGYFTFIDKIKITENFLANNFLKDFVLIPNKAGQLIRMENLLFKQSLAEIIDSSFDELNTLVSLLKEYPSMVVQLEGHTEPRGSATLNMRLSQKRVEAVRDYLIVQGIKPKRIKLKAFGGSMPLTKENTEEAINKNRRVEVRILNL
jgi:OmpA-OmpF porin, OOP family